MLPRPGLNDLLEVVGVALVAAALWMAFGPPLAIGATGVYLLIAASNRDDGKSAGPPRPGQRR